MSTSTRVRDLCTLAVALLVLALRMPAAVADTPELGTPLSRTQLGSLDFTIMPDGRGLPPGSGDARRGGDVYRTHCSRCHGEGGEGGVNDRLAGGHGSLASEAPVKTVGSYWPYATTLFDYIRRAMPYTAPGTLSDDEIYALTAYLLYVNGIIDQHRVMDAQTLPEVTMPNADNFVWAVSSIKEE